MIPLHKVVHNSGINLIFPKPAAAERANYYVINFGDGDYVKLGEWEADDRLSFRASGYQFNVGDIRLGTNQWVLLGGASLNPGTPRIGIVHSNNLHSYIDYLENLYFRVDGGGTSALILESNGNVAIGMNTSFTSGATHTQGYRLAVNGGILCEEIKVIQDVPASDFVFEDDYHLTSLEEVEAYVKQNKHLPEVPSAQEFKENGYKVGEMDDLLLRKVEELTLYIIELNKKVKEQERVIETLKTQQGNKE